MENSTPIISPGQLTALLLLAKQAGAGILSVYNTHIEVTLKDDLSPLTLADKVSHDIITEGLAALTPAIPVISEEGREVPYEIRKNWEYYW
jgi:3'(2'), 5'-bisphosphate nucleotidase